MEKFPYISGHYSIELRYFSHRNARLPVTLQQMKGLLKQALGTAGVLQAFPATMRMLLLAT